MNVGVEDETLSCGTGVYRLWPLAMHHSGKPTE